MDHEMTEENKELLEKCRPETQQWKSVRRPDGGTYVVPKNPDDQRCDDFLSRRPIEKPESLIGSLRTASGTPINTIPQS